MNTTTPRVFLLIIVVMVIALVFVELTLSKMVRYTTTYAAGIDLSFFSVILFPSLLLQYLILFTVRKWTRNIIGVNNTKYVNFIQKLVIISTVLNTILLTSLWFEMIYFSQYTVTILAGITGVSYTTSVILFALLGQRFIIWLKFYRNYVLATYAVATLLLALYVALTLINVTHFLVYQPDIIYRNSSHTSAYVVSNQLFEMFYLFSYIASFLSIWLASVLLMREYYTQRRYAYLFLSCVPLFYFVSQFQPFFIESLSYYRLSDPMTFGIYYSLFLIYSKPIGGIFFGLVFFVMAYRVRISPLKDYFILAGLGIVLFFTSNQASALVNLAYPPFGISASSFLGLSSFLVFLGIYGSALSVAQDSSLRRVAKDSVKKEFDLIGKIGLSELQQGIAKKVATITKDLTKEMEQESGIRPTLSDEEVQSYISEVIEELHGKRSSESE